MMKVILKNKNNILKEIDLNSYKIDNIVFGTDLVKEILLERETTNNQNDQNLEKLRDEFLLYKDDITEIIFYYNNTLFFSFHGQVKSVLCRIISYMQERKFIFLEKLSIRFIEDNLPIKNDLLYCSNDCPYLGNEFICSKYKKYIKNNIICKECFFEIAGVLQQKELSEFYQTSINNIINQEKYNVNNYE